MTATGPSLPTTADRIRPNAAQISNAMRLRADLLANGHTISAIARRIGVTPSAVTHTLRGGGSARIRRYVARLLGRRVKECWPGRAWRRRRTPAQMAKERAR